MSDDIRKRIDEITRRCEQATPGPWIRRYKGSVHELSPHEKVEYNLALIDKKVNAEFVANAREDVPFLTALVRSQHAGIVSLTARMVKLEDEFCLSQTDFRGRLQGRGD